MTTEKFETFVDASLHWEKNLADYEKWIQPMGGDKDNVKSYTWAQGMAEARRMASYIASLNLEPGSKIAIVSKNCVWFMIADMAIWMAGHASVPIYPTLTAETVQYSLEHSESKLLFVGKLDKNWDEVMKAGVPADMPTVSFPLSPEGDYIKWDDLLKEHEPMADDQISKRTAEEVATIIYTSGSTGQPKGVMHSFKTMMDPTNGFWRDFGKKGFQDRILSYLPLAHGMARWTDECCPAVNGTLKVYFAESLKTFAQDLQRAEPTLFLSVPRLWTKFQAGVFQKMPPKKLATLLSVPILSMLVKKKIKTALGLSKCRIAGSGSAPLSPELLAWYRRLGLELLEGYGMTENFNYSHINPPGKPKVGTVGKAYVDVKHRINPDDEEIQVLSPGLMLGYYKDPQKTAETMTEDGYLRTGDRGKIDKNGYLTITGRTKELFKTSKGKYVSPAPIESKINDHAKVALSLVGGASRPEPYALVQLAEDIVDKIKADDSLKQSIGEELEQHLKVVNATIDAHENLTFFAIVIADEWTPDNGMLTPTQKIKRGTIEDKYKEHEDGWYDAKKKVVWL